MLTIDGFSTILEFSGWEKTESKVMDATFFHLGDTHWMIDNTENISEENKLLAFWKAAARCLEVAKPDPANLLHPWMPIAMALQALDSDKLYHAILNFIDVYNYKRESKGAKEDSKGAPSGDEDGTESGSSER